MYCELIDFFESGLILFISRLLTEDPHQRLGAGGASEVNLTFISSLFSSLFMFMHVFHCTFNLLKAELLIQVKQHVFFKDINWDTLARQKV